MRERTSTAVGASFRRDNARRPPSVVRSAAANAPAPGEIPPIPPFSKGGPEKRESEQLALDVPLSKGQKRGRKAGKAANGATLGFEEKLWAAAANRLAEMPEVVFAEPDMIFTWRSDFIPNDPEFEDSWGLLNTAQFPGAVPGFDVNVVDAWDYTVGDPDIVTVVIDVGVQQNHPDINQIPGRDFTFEAGNGGPVTECDNHGTPVAGVISGRINNLRGTAGVAPLTRIASARTFISDTDTCDGRWDAQFSWTADALKWARDIGARITVNSNSYNEESNAVAGDCGFHSHLPQLTAERR